MKFNKVMTLPAMVFLSMSMGGQVLAQEGQELTDREYCEQEAEQAGMVDPDDIRDYVEQCIAEIIGQRNDEDGGGEDNGDGEDSHQDDSMRWE